MKSKNFIRIILEVKKEYAKIIETNKTSQLNFLNQINHSLLFNTRSTTENTLCLTLLNSPANILSKLSFH